MAVALAAGCGATEDEPTSGITLELPSSATTRPGKHVDLDAYVRGTTRWDTATCTVTAGTCTMHVIEPQHFRLDIKTPRMLGSVTVTFAHDGEGGRPGAPAVPLSATAEITLEGRVVPPYLIPTLWQDSEHIHRVNDIAFSNDGARVASAASGVVKIHEWVSGRPIASLPVGYPESEVFVVDPSYPAESVELTPGDASALVGTYAYVLRLKDTSGEETGRIKLDDLPGDQGPTIVRDLSCHAGSGRCVAVRAPREPCPASQEEALRCYSGLYAIDDPKAPVLAARTITTSNAGEIWSRVALSPSGTQVAVLHQPGNTIRVYDVSSGAEVQRIDDTPRPGLDWVYLDWTEDNHLVTSWSTFEVSGAHLGDGVAGRRAQATWRNQRRVTMYAEQVGWGRLRFTELPGLATRLSTGYSGAPAELVVARDAPYLAVQVTDDGSSLDPQLDTIRVYDVRDGSLRRVFDTPDSAGHGFDMCADGRMVFVGADRRVYTAAPVDDYTPVVIDDATLASPIWAIVPPPTGIAYDCRVLTGAGSERTAIVNATDRVVESSMAFAAIHAALAGLEAEPYSLTHFFSPPTLGGAPPRILEANGDLVIQPPGNIVRWSAGQDTIWLFDDTGGLTPWTLATGAAGPSLRIANAAIADRSFYVPSHRIGTLLLTAGQQLRVDPGAADYKIDLTHGAAIPRMAVEAHGHTYIAGDSFIGAHPQEAIHDRVLEIIDP